ncbi:DUF4192 domain-containing protein [Nocardia otitidiscaviarum]|uniref:DUF4192 domain-containing protein n=1 Tax=Nocardia otitidiscaviarum TaxID=1823 RepID=UPI00069470CD|nr:DUF4192 domain-containing protein [Nocardia otitidiscaviarum]MBF6138182.1 DUF4192 domain-containing protein [Nocardia otitidiscaviarum]MBF6489005.1 DUF4192 domain-containing protein [Nocardia otitidiscaviarum]
MTNSTEPLPAPPPGDAPRYRYCESARIPRHRGRRTCSGGNTFPPDDFGTERWLPPPPDALADDDPPPVEGGETPDTCAAYTEPPGRGADSAVGAAATASAGPARSPEQAESREQAASPEQAVSTEQAASPGNALPAERAASVESARYAERATSVERAGSVDSAAPIESAGSAASAQSAEDAIPVDDVVTAESAVRADSAATDADAALFGNAAVPQQHLREPGEFIAAVPAMLGFVPARSLVLAVLRAEAGRSDTAAVDVVVRVDIDVTGRVAVRAMMDQLADICVRQRAVAALALIVDDRATVPDARHRGVRARRHRELTDLLAARLAAADVTLTGAWAVAGFDAGRPWWSVPDPANAGAQRAPADSPVTFRQVLDGRPLRGSRAELAAVVAVDADARAAVAAVLESAVTAAQARLAAAVRRGEAEVYTRAALRKVLWQLANVESGARLHPAEIAELAVALRNPVVRDVMFALAPGDHAAAAEALWIHLTGVLPDPDRAEAAALLGYCAYVRGDGPLAGVALDAALASDPDHTMARLLETALRNGLRPAQLRRIAETGREAAAILGVDLGPELS